MPKEFTDCQKNGGKIVTKSLPGNKYVHGCKGKDGKMVWGEIKERKTGLLAGDNEE